MHATYSRLVFYVPKAESNVDCLSYMNLEQQNMIKSTKSFQRPT